MLAGVPVLLAKVQQYKPRVVCFVGKQIGELFCKEAAKLTGGESALHSSDASLNVSGKGVTSSQKRKDKKTFEWGVQPFKVVHSQHNNIQSNGDMIFHVRIYLSLIRLYSMTGIQRRIKETLFFVMPSTSARVAGYQVCHALTSSCSSMPVLTVNGWDSTTSLPIKYAL